MPEKDALVCLRKTTERVRKDLKDIRKAALDWGPFDPAHDRDRYIPVMNGKDWKKLSTLARVPSKGIPEEPGRHRQEPQEASVCPAPARCPGQGGPRAAAAASQNQRLEGDNGSGSRRAFEKKDSPRTRSRPFSRPRRKGISGKPRSSCGPCWTPRSSASKRRGSAASPP